MNGRRHLLVAAVVAALVALVGCGVPIDEAPRTITQTTIAPVDETPTTIAGTSANEVSVYFLRGERLERQGYPVEGEATLAQAIGFVLEAPAEGSSSQLRTSVPPGTTLLGVDVADGVATVNLSTEIDDVAGPAQKEAFAQIVFTTLAFEGVQRVQFFVNGEAIDAPTDDGNLAVISADNYDTPLNPR